MKRNALYKVLLAVLVVFIGASAEAQQLMGNTQYIWNQMAVNPAYAGSKEGLSTGLFYRNQWTGFEGAPRTENVFIHTPLAHGAFGTGLNIMRDRLGISSQLSAQASFSYKLKFDHGTMSLGLSGEYASTRMDWANVNPYDQNDQAIPFATVTEPSFNFGFGAYYSNEFMFASLSVPRLLESNSDFSNLETNVNAVIQARRHVHFIAGGMWRAGRELWIHPMLMTRYVVGAPVQVDLGCLLYLNRSIWVGSTYRWGDSFSVLMNYEVTRQLRVGYAFDFTVTQLQGHAGSHEFFLGYDLVKQKDGFNHPRFF